MLVEPFLLNAGEEYEVQKEEEIRRGVVLHLEEALPGEEGVLQAPEHLVPLIDAAVGEAPAPLLGWVPPGFNYCAKVGL